jgi:hypothetical protein
MIGVRLKVDRAAAIKAGKGLGGNWVYAGEIDLLDLSEKQREILAEMFPYPSSVQAELKLFAIPAFGEAMSAWKKGDPKYPEPDSFFTPVAEATPETAKRWLAEAELFSNALTDWLEKTRQTSVAS